MHLALGTDVRTWRSLASLVIVMLAIAVVTSGCWNTRTGEASVHGIANFTLPAFPQTGSHKFVVFSEMHYSPSYRSQEGPRLLPPPDSVPVTGKALKLGTLEEARSLTIPDQPHDAARAAELFRVNCVVCHGLSMQGDGPMLPMIKSGPVPADLMGPISSDATDGELFAFITRGGRQGITERERGRPSTSPMPAFEYLLTEEERWQLVKYLRDEQEGR